MSAKRPDFSVTRGTFSYPFHSRPAFLGLGAGSGFLPQNRCRALRSTAGGEARGEAHAGIEPGSTFAEAGVEVDAGDERAALGEEGLGGSV